MDKPQFSRAFRAELETLFAWRRDVRRFRTDPVDEDDMRDLFRAAALAPSVGNAQPWRFVRVKSPAIRRSVIAHVDAENQRAAAAYDPETRRRYLSLKLHGLGEAPEQVAVFCDETTDAGRGLGRRTMPETLRYSTVMAIHDLWLAARARGVGVGWVSILDPDAVATLLDVPASWTLIAWLCIGYPGEEHDDPELARFGWQARLPVEGFVFER